MIGAFLERLRRVEAATRPAQPEMLAALRRRWEELPGHVRHPAQLLGRRGLGCEGTHGVFPRCNLACTPCYHGRDANRVRVDGAHTVAEVDRQMALLRARRGPRAFAQLIGGEVSLLDPDDHAAALEAMRAHGREPMSMSHGDFDWEYLRRLALGPDGRRRFARLSFAGHFDSLMCCISNPVAGPLVGNARWTGVPLADLLRQAGPTAAAVAVEAVAADGYRETYPLAALADQDVLVAFGMNGAELPQQHGYPARLLVPGHYGMKSVKWLTQLTLLQEPAAGYWEQRGWDPVATIRTQSRIDAPADHAAVPPRFTVAGIAWAGDRRVARVQVLVDDHGPWRPAVLEREADPLGWRRWRLGLQLPAGLHTLTVRAIDGIGQAQAAERLPPHPSGASGYHRIVVRVRPA